MKQERRSSVGVNLESLEGRVVLSAFGYPGALHAAGATAAEVHTAAAATKAASGTTVAFTGTVPWSGNGKVDLTFTVYDSARGGKPLFTESQRVTVERGTFQATLGAATPGGLPRTLGSHGTMLYISVSYNMPFHFQIGNRIPFSTAVFAAPTSPAPTSPAPTGPVVAA